MRDKPDKLSDQVRQAIGASGLSRYRICRSIGLDQSTMSRFMAGKGGLSLETLDALWELLGLRVVGGGNPLLKRKG
jgi:transcriptional regulator with XRE-family HTH domain